MTMNPPVQDLSWLLDEFEANPGVLHAMVLSADGLKIQKSSSLSEHDSEVLSASASALYSLAGGSGERFHSGPVGQVLIEYNGEQGHVLLIVGAGKNARLAVLCDQTADLGSMGYAMARLVRQVGQIMGTQPRVPAGDGQLHV
jgi:predicted regulator of Ras-like GTPase activity (Roadblock/LC7/MglB family)